MLADAEPSTNHGRKGALISQILAAVSDASELERNNVWIYLVDIPARQMVELGHVLPEAGDEPAWMAALPESLTHGVNRSTR